MVEQQRHQSQYTDYHAPFDKLLAKFVNEAVSNSGALGSSRAYREDLKAFIHIARQEIVSYSPGQDGKIFFTNFVDGAESLDFELGRFVELFNSIYENVGVADGNDYDRMRNRDLPWLDTVTKLAANLDYIIDDRDRVPKSAQLYQLGIASEIARYLKQPLRYAGLTRDLLNLSIDSVLMVSTCSLASLVRYNSNSSVPQRLRTSVWNFILVVPAVVGFIERLSIWKAGITQVRPLEALRQQLAAGGPITAGEIRNKLRATEQVGTIWPGAIFMLLDDMERRDDILV